MAELPVGSSMMSVTGKRPSRASAIFSWRAWGTGFLLLVFGPEDDAIDDSLHSVENALHVRDEAFARRTRGDLDSEFRDGDCTIHAPDNAYGEIPGRHNAELPA